MDFRDKHIGRYFYHYTIIFGFMMIFVYFTFLVNGKSILWQPDGYALHWTTLAYYGEWLRKLAANFVSGTFSVPEYDFSIGYGSSIIPTLHWDVIGDPLNLFSIFVSPEKTETLVTVLMIARLWLAGASFSLFCLSKPWIRNRFAVCAGAFSYIFCGYSIFTSARHPLFINPMIWLPLLMIGIDRVRRERKHGLFAFLVFLCVMCSFYFSYMLAIFSLAYFVLSWLAEADRRRVRDFFAQLAHLVLPGVIGILMGCVLLIPVVALYSHGLRVNTEIKYSAFYSPSYYMGMITTLLTADTAGGWSWTYTGMSVPAFLAALALYGRRSPEAAATGAKTLVRVRKALKFALAACFVMLLIPAVGSAMNGFNYVSNRWVWAFAMVFSFTLTYVWPELFKLQTRQRRVVFAGVIVYFAAALLMREGRSESMMASCALLFAGLLLVLAANLPRGTYAADRRLAGAASRAPVLMLVLTLVSVCVNAHYFYDATRGGYVYQFGDAWQAFRNTMSSDAEAARSAQVSDGDAKKVVRFESSNSSHENLNSTMLTGANGTRYYFSLANGYISQYLLDMGMDNSWLSYRYYGLSGRTFLDELAGVKYYVSQKQDAASERVPYGYNDSETYKVGPFSKKYKVYTNDYALPLGYTYSGYITRDEYENMSCFEKQEALMQGVLLENDAVQELGEDSTKEIEKAQVRYSHDSVAYEVQCGENVKQQEDGSFLVGQAGATVTLQFSGESDCETYFYVNGVKAVKKTELELYEDTDKDILPYDEYVKMSPIMRNTLKREDENATDWDYDSQSFGLKVNAGERQGMFVYRNDHNLYNIGQDEFLVNLGYSEDAVNELTITFPEAGVYSFADMQVICQPMKQYRSQAKALGSETLENEKHGTDWVSGTVDLSSDKVLVLSIPYDEGWTAWVDGKKTTIHRANVMNSALILDKGKHQIRLVYHTPGLRMGAAASLCGFAAFAMMLAVQGALRRRRA